MSELAKIKAANQSIGNIISNSNNLSDEQVSKIIEHQKANGTRFGESAVALGFATSTDVLWALSQQFNYAYAKQNTDELSTDLVTAHRPFEPPSEFFRDLRSQLITEGFFSGKTNKGLAVCSVDVGDGKSYIAANLAVVLSQLGGRTLLVDANMRSPRLSEMLAVGGSQSGLSSILSGRSEANVIRPVDVLPSLFLLPVGTVPPNPLELLQSLNFELLLQELSAKFDHIIIDTPATTMGADAYVITSKCKSALLVARKNATKKESIAYFSKQISRIGDVRLGKILNEHK